MFIAILFYALVYDDDDEDDAGLSSGAGTNLNWEARQARSAGNFLSCPSTFLALQVQLVVLVSAFVMVSTAWSISWFFVLLLSVPLCPVICKSGSTCPRALDRDRVSITFMLQFHTRKHYKIAIQSVCVQSYAQSDTFNSVL